jgi:DNA-binding NarL/FixJ family response regulator
MAHPEIPNTRIAVVSRDPYFLFAVRGLLGRSRQVRIQSDYEALAHFYADRHAPYMAANAVVCDLDSTAHQPHFQETLTTFIQENASVPVICLTEGDLAAVVARFENMPVRALLSKNDLGYCLHLAIYAVTSKGSTLVTEHIQGLLHPSSHVAKHSKVIGPHKEHPSLAARLTEILMWRIFVGLDNRDIQDELLLEHDTVRSYVSRAYKALGVEDELGAFEALSDWWWLTRFGEVINGL